MVAVCDAIRRIDRLKKGTLMMAAMRRSIKITIIPTLLIKEMGMSSRRENLEQYTTREGGAWAPRAGGEGGRKRLMVDLVVGRPVEGRIHGRSEQAAVDLAFIFLQNKREKSMEKKRRERREGRERRGRTPPFASMMGCTRRVMYTSWGRGARGELERR